MFDSDQDQKTVPASARRRATARQSGSVPRSPDVAATLVLIVFTFGLVLIAPSLLAAGKELLTGSLTNLDTDPNTAVKLTESLTAVGLGRIAAGWLLLAVAGAVIGNVVQFGLLFAPQAVQPDLERLSPGRGLQRIRSDFHIQSLLLQGGRLAMISAVTTWFVWSIWPRVASPAHSAPEAIGDTFADAVIQLGGCLAGGTVVISLLLALTARLRHEAGLRMTPQEAREEQRLNEMDPSVAGRRRAAQQQFVTAIAQDHAS